MESNENQTNKMGQKSENHIGFLDEINHEKIQLQDSKINQIESPQYPKEIKSKLSKNYKSYLKHKNINFQSISKEQLLSQLSNSEIGVNSNDQSKFSEQVIFQNIQTHQNINIFAVKIGPFRQKISILFEKKKSPFHDSSSCVNGCFGTVYSITHPQSNQEQVFAIKCLKINIKKPQILQFHIREYFFTNLFSQLGIGPKSVKRFGFDLIVWQECIEFTLEKCVQLNEIIKKFSQNHNDHFTILAQKLYKMHKLSIVHLDIKPSNIMFSLSIQQPVFIDFGCTKFIQQKIGEISSSDFIGTYEYASQEMKRIFLCGKGLIDLYFNDVEALKHSEERIFLQEKFSGLSLRQMHSKQHFQLSSYLQTTLIEFKYLLHRSDKEKLKETLETLMNSEEYITETLLYFSNLKATYSMKECFQIVHPLILKLRKLYDDQHFKRINIFNENQTRFKNVYDLIDYLEQVFIKGSELNLDQIDEEERQEPSQQFTFIEAFEASCEHQSQQVKDHSPIHRPSSGEKQFFQLYDSIKKAQNIEQIKEILAQEKLISNISTEYYFLMFLHCIDFTKNNGIDLEQKISFAKVFLTMQQKDIGQMISQKTQHLKKGVHLEHKFSELLRCLQILLDYCTTPQITQFKLMMFGKICTQVILVHSTIVASALPDLNRFIKLWLQLLVKEKNSYLLIKYSEAYKVFQCQYLVEATELNVFNFEIVEETVINKFLRDMKEDCQEWIEEDLIISQFYQQFIRRLYAIDAETEKAKEMKKRLETNFRIESQLKSYLLKVLEINTYATEILFGYIRDIKKITHFEEILMNLHKEMKENKYFMNSDQQLFIFKCKIFRLAVGNFHYQKGAILLKEIQDQVNCDQIKSKMFLLEKCYMMKAKSLINLSNLIKSLCSMDEQNLKGVNYDFIGTVIGVIKFKVYNIYLQKKKPIPTIPFKEIEAQILKLAHIKQREFEKNHCQTKKVYFYWFETLSSIINISQFFKRQFFTVYQSYYHTNIKQNKGHYYRLNYMYTKLKVEQFYAESQQKLSQVVQMLGNELTSQIEELLAEKDVHFFGWRQKRQAAHDSRPLELDEVLNLYFKTVITIVSVPLQLRYWKRKYAILLKLVQIAEEHNHYLSFFQGYSLVFDVLMALTNNVMEISVKCFSSRDLIPTFPPAILCEILRSEAVTNTKSLLWNFIFKLSINLTLVANQEFNINFIKQLEQYFFQVQSQFFELSSKQLNSSDAELRKSQIIDIAEFIYIKMAKVQEIKMQKHNGLVLFQVFVFCLKKRIFGLDFTKEKKTLWKLTRSLDFMIPFLRKSILPRYFCIFGEQIKKISFRKFLLIHVENAEKQIIHKYFEINLSHKPMKWSNRKIECIIKQKMRRYEKNKNRV